MKIDTRNNHTRTQQNRQTNDTHKTYIVLKFPVIDMHLKKSNMTQTVFCMN